MRLATANPHVLSRLAKILDRDGVADEMLRLENRERAFAQSAATKDGKRAEPPQRKVAGRGLGR